MRLQNAPLVHVLVEVSFSPVPDLGSKIRMIQAELRGEGFPWLSEGATHHVSLTPGNIPQLTVRPRWLFHDADRTTAVVLSDSSLAVHTARYTSVEPFLEQFRGVVRLVRTAAMIELVSRIGMRYIDRVPHSEEDGVREFVVPGLLGFPLRELEEAQGVGSLRTEITGLTATGVLAVRSVLLRPEEIVPPDLDPGQVAYPRPPKLELPGLAIDFDHFTVFETKFQFDPDKIVSHVERLHTTLRSAFDVAVTPHAIDTWGPWEEI